VVTRREVDFGAHVLRAAVVHAVGNAIKIRVLVGAPRSRADEGHGARNEKINDVADPLRVRPAPQDFTSCQKIKIISTGRD